MKKSIKLFSAILAAAIMLTGSSVIFALDTTETYGVGAFTDFEGYATAGFGEGGKKASMELLIGGGIIEQLSYSLIVGVSNQQEITEISNLALGFIWAIVKNEQFGLTLMPSFSFIPNATKGNISYPEFTAFTPGVELEINFKMPKVVQPYLRAGYNFTYDANKAEYSWDIPLAVGTMVPLKEGVELFVQLSWAPTNLSTWENTERTAAVGLNVMTVKNLELIMETGWEFTANEFYATIGLIYAL